jgi:threonine aldolase
MPIELRSDTFTKPSKEMLEAMFSAKVGDDVFGEDETVNELELKAAKLFGFEKALFCTSGTMTNQIAINVHCQGGDEIICSDLSHIYLYEGGGIMANSGASVKLLKGDKGRISAKDVKENISPDDVHACITKLVSLENTVNKGGGSIYQFAEIEQIKQVCVENNMALHLDGARLFNALVETGETPSQFAENFDSISICLSKGLGAPVGSLLLGNGAFIKQARRIRKRFGGGWRQAGFLAAAGIYALDNNLNRLKEDHKRANTIGEIMRQRPEIEDIFPVETNIVIAQVNEKILAADYVKMLAKSGINAVTFGKYLVRFVTHLDFTDDDLALFETTMKTKAIL